MSSLIHGQRIDIRDITPDKEHVPPTKKSGKIYIRSVKGKIESIRRTIGLSFITLFILLPWLTYSGRQAILLSFTDQQFHLFGLTLWPQDLTILTWLFIMSAFALFTVTALFGRVWCGFMCPQTVFTFLFVWVEEKVEGARNKRIHLDKQPLSTSKLLKKFTKHAVWLSISAITALTFIGYFTPIKPLLYDILTLNIAFWPFSFVVFFMLCTYANAGWMREIMCTHMCPYSRFQSSMFDNDTLTVTYNPDRGEGRGPRSRKLTQDQYKSRGLGDCIDCNLCVQVCPAGIDIREGFQYECINCGACVDACNGVMSNMGYEKNLISFDSVNAAKGKAKSILRPKVVGYLLVLLTFVILFFMNLAMIRPLNLDVIRDRNALYRETVRDSTENVYTLMIMNKTQQEQSVRIQVHGLESAEIIGTTELTIPKNKSIQHPISIEVRMEHIKQSITPFSIDVINEKGDIASSEVTFIARN